MGNVTHGSLLFQPNTCSHITTFTYDHTAATRYLILNHAEVRRDIDKKTQPASLRNSLARQPFENHELQTTLENLMGNERKTKPTIGTLGHVKPCSQTRNFPVRLQQNDQQHFSIPCEVLPDKKAIDHSRTYSYKSYGYNTEPPKPKRVQKKKSPLRSHQDNQFAAMEGCRSYTYMQSSPLRQLHFRQAELRRDTHRTHKGLLCLRAKLTANLRKPWTWNPKNRMGNVQTTWPKRVHKNTNFLYTTTSYILFSHVEFRSQRQKPCTLSHHQTYSYCRNLMEYAALERTASNLIGTPNNWNVLFQAKTCSQYTNSAIYHTMASLLFSVQRGFGAKKKREAIRTHNGGTLSPCETHYKPQLDPPFPGENVFTKKNPIPVRLHQNHQLRFFSTAELRKDAQETWNETPALLRNSLQTSENVEFKPLSNVKLQILWVTYEIQKPQLEPSFPGQNVFTKK